MKPTNCWILVLLAVSLWTVPTRAENITLTVIHTNDIHGWVMPRPAAFQEAGSKRLIGGMPAFSAWLKKTPSPRLVVDVGDWFQGTPEGAIDEGRALMELFNVAGYDAFTVGNHDFDYGEKNLVTLAHALRAPVLCANIYRENDGKRHPDFKPWIIKDVVGVKVGLFGLTTSRMKGLAFPENIEGLRFRREIDEAKDSVAALRKEGATVIIALSHMGFARPDEPPFEDDQALAAQVEGIDLIVGGHSHTPLKNPVREAKHGTLIVQAGSWLTRAGEVTLEIDPKTKRVVKSSGRLVDLWLNETGEDPATAQTLAKLTDKVRPIYDVVLATAAMKLKRSAESESNLGDWMTDCELDWAGADVAIQNGGGIRDDIDAGPVTKRAIFNLMPFDNRIAKLTLKGKDLRRALDHGVGMGRIVQLSGAIVSYKRKAPEGERIVSITVGGKPLEDEAVYKVATLDFLATGGDDYASFGSALDKDITKALLRDVLCGCARKNGLITAPSAGRLLPVGD